MTIYTQLVAYTRYKNHTMWPLWFDISVSRRNRKLIHVSATASLFMSTMAFLMVVLMLYNLLFSSLYKTPHAKYLR